MGYPYTHSSETFFLPLTPSGQPGDWIRNGLAGSDAGPPRFYIRSAMSDPSNERGVKLKWDDHRRFDNRAGFRRRLARRDVTLHADMDYPFSGFGKLGFSAVGCGHWISIQDRDQPTIGFDGEYDRRLIHQPAHDLLTNSLGLAAMLNWHGCFRRTGMISQPVGNGPTPRLRLVTLLTAEPTMRPTRPPGQLISSCCHTVRYG
jgi:hypothetical protein